MTDVEEIKKLLKEEKIIIGTERVISGLRKKKIAKVFIASNCAKDTIQDINRFSDLSDVQVVKLEFPNDELGLICKKPFSISVLGVVR